MQIQDDIYTKVADGDEQAFGQLFRRYVPRLQAMFFRVTGSGTVADDLTQETFLKVWIARDQLQTIAKPDAWILRIGFLLALNYVRRQKIYDKALVQTAINLTGEEQKNAVMEGVEFQQMLDLIGEAVRRLPEKQRTAYVMSREQGLPIAEIAQNMGLAVSTVKNLLVMALKEIRGFLETAGYPVSMLLINLFL